MTKPQADKIGEAPAYWTHGVDAYPSPVAQFRMAQLIDFDDRLYETARVVYRFMVGWYHDGHGDALLSQRHVAKVMKQRAPGAVVPSRNAVQRAIIALMDTGWVVRSYQGRGKGKGASRYIPVFNVLDLAAQGKFPQPAHDTGPVQPARVNGPLVARANGPVDAEPAHTGGPKTRLHDPVTKTRVHVVMDSSAPVAGEPLAAAPDGFERLFAAYDHGGSDKRRARMAFNGVNPEAAELERMVVAAASWRRTASGKRLSLERWLNERRWLSGDEFANDNRKTHRYPSCVITRIKPRYDKEETFDGAQIWFRNRDGATHTRVLDGSEYTWLQECCYENQRLADPSEDLHEFVGARFQIDDDGLIVDPAEHDAA